MQNAAFPEILSEIESFALTSLCNPQTTQETVASAPRSSDDRTPECRDSPDSSARSPGDNPPPYKNPSAESPPSQSSSETPSPHRAAQYTPRQSASAHHSCRRSPTGTTFLHPVPAGSAAWDHAQQKS